ncbi:hypothetical protein MF271_05670 [Deinococcus sp. KNUC1210]|uniref:hypothetical protein n=1 Tax=Deinococcus sp. KNUC1210 TaxID=2917691 RepID=UPI001EF06BDB|nr:hypothetical protein [Deinococcus sp. KNUC1210]ULH16113.1 hypothetical protein MF271_05670 [Deinococcus sp. KNUC1210]
MTPPPIPNSPSSEAAVSSAAAVWPADLPGPPRLKAAFPAALRRVLDIPEVLGVVWAGSAAMGEADEHADLDFYTLVSGQERWRLSWVVDGVPVEVFCNAAGWHEQYAERQDASSLAMLLAGRVVLSHPKLLELIEQARVVWEAGRTPEPLAPAERHKLTDEVWEARSMVGQPGYVLQSMASLKKLIPALYQVRGWWDCKPKHWTTDLERRDPEAARQVRAVLEAAADDQRQAALDVFALSVLGSLDALESVTQRQSL